MEYEINCQSCGMPIIDEKEFGTNHDESKNNDYCHSCFRQGSFTQDCTMDEMIDFCLSYLDEFNEASLSTYSKDKARQSMLLHLPTLKRWIKE